MMGVIGVNKDDKTHFMCSDLSILCPRLGTCSSRRPFNQGKQNKLKTPAYFTVLEGRLLLNMSSSHSQTIILVVTGLLGSASADWDDDDIYDWDDAHFSLAKILGVVSC